ncbi:MerR family transcriptional regulator [Lactococcus nasutitermitis]|uniref:MerR family transcriptional regulator n=1 Tax=Lactococcus nasutitermitis TaxID=1652957 RepID=A0ABV9JFK2_9LACT|nr:MerR family transcriptional regulator [Lactococcus nasutitermitis]
MAKHISKIAESLGISAPTLRFYEQKGLYKAPRTHSGIRTFDDETLRQIYSIVQYRKAGVPVDDVKKIVDTPEAREIHLNILKENQQKIQMQIEELQQTLDFLEFKIGCYQGENPAGQYYRLENEWLQAAKN